MAADPSWANVALLLEPSVHRGLCDDSLKGLVPALNSSPYSVVDTDPDFPDGAIKTDGAQFTLEFGFNTAFNFAAQAAWTIEWEAKYGTLPNPSALLITRDTEAAGRAQLYVGPSTDTLHFNRYGRSEYSLSGSTTIPLNTKVHILVSREAGATGVIRAFFNGVYVGTTGDANALGNGRGALLVATPPGAGNYLGRVRVTNGVARSVGNFTPPTGPYLKAGTISGVVLDSTGTPTARVVTAIDRVTKRVSGVCKSNATTGAYTIHTPTLNEHDVIAHDDDAGTLQNDLIARVIPA